MGIRPTSWEASCNVFHLRASVSLKGRRELVFFLTSEPWHWGGVCVIFISSCAQAFKMGIVFPYFIAKEMNLERLSELPGGRPCF